MRRNRIKKKKKLQMLIILLLISTFTISVSYSRYVSEVDSSAQVRVAKTGKITLIEKNNGVVQTNNLDTISEVSYEIVSGGIIDKEVYVEFSDSEVSTYLFLVVDGVNWSYDDNLKKIIVLNNGASLLSFDINEIWTFLEEVSVDDKLVFYHLVDVNDNNTSKYDVMNQIDIGLINVKDEEKINNSSLKFNAYSIQKNNDDSAVEAWNYLNL